MTFSFTIPFWKSGSHSYDPVPAPDEEILLASPDGKDTHIKRSSKRTFTDPSFWLTALAALSIAITIRNLLVIQLRSQEPYVSYLEAPVARPYTGLEKLPRNESSPSWPLSSTLHPDFIGSTQGTIVHHALNNGSVVRLDSEVRILTMSNPVTHLYSLIPYSARSSYSTAFAITASSIAPSNCSFLLDLENSKNTPRGHMGTLGRAPTSLCGA